MWIDRLRRFASISDLVSEKLGAAVACSRLGDLRECGLWCSLQRVALAESCSSRAVAVCGTALVEGIEPSCACATVGSRARVTEWCEQPPRGMRESLRGYRVCLDECEE